MAKKRRIGSIEKTKPSAEPEELEKPRHTESWPIWIRNEFLRYWFIVGCLFLDAMVFLQVYLTPDRPIVLATVLLIASIILEAFAYWRIWGKRQREQD